MKSTIKVDFKGPETSSKGGFEPVIRVSLQDSDDVRDKLLKTFFQSLGGESSWLVVKIDPGWEGFPKSNVDNIKISPLKPEEMEETIKIIQTRLEDRFNILK